jgi:hypothetical protein
VQQVGAYCQRPNTFSEAGRRAGVFTGCRNPRSAPVIRVACGTQ